MRSSMLAVLVAVLLSVTLSGSARADAKIGIVLMHGKLGVPFGATFGKAPTIGGELITALRHAGYLVATPEMCWSHTRSFDRTYADCFHDIDAAIANLKSHGATAIVVGGLSLGGNAAIAYGATHPGLLGVIALGPADDPTEKETARPEVAASLAKARDLAAHGKGDQKTCFDDYNTGPQGFYDIQVCTTPRIFLSFFEPDSLANIPANVAKLTMPLLWVAGTNDPTQGSAKKAYEFDKVPSNPLNRYVNVPAGHLETPDAAAPAVLAWLKDLMARQ